MTILRSLLYALLGGIPSMLLGITAMALMAFIGVFDPDINLIISTESYSQAKFYQPFFEFFRQYYFLAYPVAGIGYVAIFFVILRLLNPNFSRYYFKVNSISKWRIAVWLSISIMVIAVVSDAASLIHPIASIFPATLLFWLLWHRYGLWGNLLAFSKEKEKRTSLFRPVRIQEERHFLAIGIRAVCYSIGVAVIVGISMVTISLLFFVIKSSYVGSMLLPIKDIFLWGIAVYCFVGAIPVSLTYALADVTASWRQLIARLVIPLLILTASAILPVSARALLEEYDYLRSVATTTGADTVVAVSQRVMAFEENGPYVYEYPINASMESLSYSRDMSMEDIIMSRLPLETQSIACTQANIKKFTDWIFLGKSSSLTVPVFNLLKDCYAMTWDLDQLIRARYQAFSITNEMLFGLQLISRKFATAQENTLHIRFLQILLNDPFTHINERGKQRIQEVLDHYASASKTRGYIAGRFFVHTTPAANMKVGLLMNSITDEQKKLGQYNYGEYVESLDKDLVASTKTDSYGRFFFPALREGTYILGAIIPKDMSANIDDVRALTVRDIGPLKIEGDAASVALDSIFLFAKDEVPQDGKVVLPSAVDSDEDGLSDEEEKYYGTDPNSIDTDKDGFSDYNELNSGYDPFHPKARYYPKVNF